MCLPMLVGLVVRAVVRLDAATLSDRASRVSEVMVTVVVWVNRVPSVHLLARAVALLSAHTARISPMV